MWVLQHYFVLPMCGSLDRECWFREYSTVLALEHFHGVLSESCKCRAVRLALFPVGMSTDSTKCSLFSYKLVVDHRVRCKRCTVATGTIFILLLAVGTPMGVLRSMTRVHRVKMRNTAVWAV